MRKRKLTIEDLAATGAELDDDRLARVAGGMAMRPARPTVDTLHGNYDAPGRTDLTNGHDI